MLSSHPAFSHLSTLLSVSGVSNAVSSFARQQQPTQAPVTSGRVEGIAMLVFNLLVMLAFTAMAVGWGLYHKKMREREQTENRKIYRLVLFYFILLAAGYFLEFLFVIAPAAVNLSSGTLAALALTTFVLKLVILDLQAWVVMVLAIGYGIAFMYEGAKKKLIIISTVVYSLGPLLTYIIFAVIIYETQSRGGLIGGIIFLVIGVSAGLVLYIFSFVRLSRQTVDHLPNLGVAVFRKDAFLRKFKAFRVTGIVAVAMPLLVGGLGLLVSILVTFEVVGAGVVIFFGIASPILAKCYQVAFAAVVFWTFMLHSGENLRFLDGAETYTSTDDEYGAKEFGINNDF